MKVRIKPMTMTAAAATLSPKNLVCRDKNEDENPIKKRAGTVPRPKEIMVRNPAPTFWVVAAFTIIAQEKPHGKNPAANPKTIFELRCRDWKSEEIRRFQEDSGLIERGVKNPGSGRTFKRTKPRKIIKAPPKSVTPPRRFA